MFSFQCEEKEMSDFLQIGGSSGLDTANMLVSDSVCGAAREPSNFVEFRRMNSGFLSEMTIEK
jgi:hypothetical protein